MASWTYDGLTLSGCANPDNDVNGAWCQSNEGTGCLLSDGSTSTTWWFYCTASPSPPTPPGGLCDCPSNWLGDGFCDAGSYNCESAACMLDSGDCITSPSPPPLEPCTCKDGWEYYVGTTLYYGVGCDNPDADPHGDWCVTATAPEACYNTIQATNAYEWFYCGRPPPSPPLPPTLPPNLPQPPSAPSLSMDISCSAGSYPDEIGWTLSCSDGTILSGGAPYASTLAVAIGATCDLTMTDSFGDGWNGAECTGFGGCYTTSMASGIDAESTSFVAASCLCCSNACSYPSDGFCDDGGPRSEWSVCASGTDCEDCGSRCGSRCTCQASWTYEGVTSSGCTMQSGPRFLRPVVRQ